MIYFFYFKGSDVTKTWYDEVNEYDWNNPVFSTSTQSFTQLVWKNSREMGIGVAIGEDNSVVVCANYFPAGNEIGEFEENVCKPTNASNVKMKANETNNFSSINI